MSAPPPGNRFEMRINARKAMPNVQFVGHRKDLVRARARQINARPRAPRYVSPIEQEFAGNTLAGRSAAVGLKVCGIWCGDAVPNNLQIALRHIKTSYYEDA
jgi:hypothetical protein